MTKTQDTKTEEAAAPSSRGFRSNTEVENLYRFVHETSLREEAATLLKYVYSKTTKPVKRTRKKRKLQ